MVVTPSGTNATLATERNTKIRLAELAADVFLGVLLLRIVEDLLGIPELHQVPGT